MKNKLTNNKNVEIITVNQNNDSEIRFNINNLNDSTFKRILSYYDSISTSPTEYLMTGLLASLSGAIGKNVFYKITNSMKIHLNIWAVIIGKSSIMRKTTALNTVKEDLQRIETQNYKIYKNDLTKWKNDFEKNKSIKEFFDEPKPERKYVLFPNDSTIESLSEILSKSQRGLLAHSEFGSFLAQLNRGYSGDSKQFLTTIFDIPESYEVSRATKENTYLESPYLSIIGASTIDWVKENSTDADLRTGFFARMIFSIRNIPDKPFIPILKLSEITKQSENAIDTRALYQYLIDIDREIELDIEVKARERHIKYDFESYKELLQTENENEMSFKARLLIYSLKFAGIIAITDKRQFVTINDIEDSIQLTEYYKKNVVQLLNAELSQDDFSRSEDKILKLIESNNNLISRTDLLNKSNQKAKGLDEIISNLIQKEKVKEIIKQNETYGKKGRFYQRII